MKKEKKTLEETDSMIKQIAHSLFASRIPASVMTLMLAMSFMFFCTGCGSDSVSYYESEPEIPIEDSDPWSHPDYDPWEDEHWDERWEAHSEEWVNDALDAFYN